MKLQAEISLKPYNTFHVDVKAKSFGTFNSLDSLANLLQNEREKLLILGGGSNLLFTKDFHGMVLKNEIEGIDVTAEDDQHVFLKVGAGVNWHRFVLHCVENDFGGIENLSLIPGNVGASPMQNIGAYGVEIRDVFHELEAWHILEGKLHTFTLRDCEFGYRDSVFKQRYKDEFIITTVTYRLSKKPVLNLSYDSVRKEIERLNVQEISIKDVSNAVINIRRSKLPDPAVIGNAGSFFKNPVISLEEFIELKEIHPTIVAFPQPDSMVKLAAGWLIENCGWKGYRKGDAGCHKEQALVLVNHGNASGGEIFRLSEEILQSVKKKFGVELEREVNIY
jgi:UDP-N-acetylmuramate dehydrogenase